ncbi:alpha-amylase family glycosyl hydrolase [Novosphingobium sp.]|uniref:alpha-amylase family glycosyl hydrolase n=1 Tax=Novosphingobium sp. TaxID=1874826 RepID=UPI0033410DD0
MALRRTGRGLSAWLTVLLALVCPIAARPAAAAPGPDGEIFYHVFVRSFRDADGDRIGDLDGLVQGLDYIKGLGVTTVLLTPVQPSPFYHNYFATDFRGVAPEYGGMAAWSRLVRAAHAHGLRVTMDLEFQYVAGGHPWLTQTWHHPRAPRRDWLMWDKARRGVDPLATPFGMYAGAADGTSHAIAYVNLDNPAVRRYFQAYLLRWADPHGDGSGRDGVDGFRIDHMMDDLDNAHAVTNLFDGFWRPLIAAVKARRPGLRFVGEQWDWGHGHDFLARGHADMVFAFPLRDALIKLDKDAILKEVAATQAATPVGKNQVVFLENHDTDRVMGMIGNDPAKARAAAAILFSLRGEPSVYYGQELGMRGRKGPAENTDAPDIPRREAFRWKADLEAPGSAIWYRSMDRVWQPRVNVSNDGVSVEEQDHAPGSLLNWYRRLIGLRRTRPELASGDQAFPCAAASRVLCVLRSKGVHRTLVLVNLSDAPAAPAPDATVSMAGMQVLVGDGEGASALAPYATRILGTR